MKAFIILSVISLASVCLSFTCPDCHSAAHISECIGHNRTCHNTETCEVKIEDAKFHSNCHRKTDCALKEGHNDALCADGTLHHHLHCTFCCNDAMCFDTHLDKVHSQFPLESSTIIQCPSCNDITFSGDCVNSLADCNDLGHNVCQMQVHGRQFTGKCHKVEDCVKEQLKNPPSCHGDTRDVDDKCTRCCTSNDCVNRVIRNVNNSTLSFPPIG